ncbi:MAG: HEAT repeat domain-containing protein [Planctomycetes bacterium]|nr:HEAT repeat domain-containing protein [Planctomycetota bacterium]
MGPQTGLSLDPVGPEPWTEWWDVNRARYLERARLPRLPRTGEGIPSGGRAESLADWRTSSHPGPALAARFALKEVRAALADESPYVRSAAAYTRGKIGGPGALEDLRPLLSDPVVRVRELAALGLGFLGGEEVPGILADVLENSRDLSRPGDRDHARAFAALGLAMSAEPSAVASLVRALSDDREEVRCAAARALGLLEDEGAIVPLVEALRKDPSPAVRGYAASALGRSRDPRAVPALLAATSARSEEVRRAATLALGEVAGPRDPGVLPRLAEFLASDRDGTTRGYAAIALGEVGGPAAEQALLRELSQGRPRALPWAALGVGLLLLDEPSAEARKVLLGAFEKHGRDPRLRVALSLAAGLAGLREAEGEMRAFLHAGQDPVATVYVYDALVLLEWRDRLVPNVAADLSLFPELSRALTLGLFARLAGDQSISKALLTLAFEPRNRLVGVAGAYGVGYAGDVSAVDELASILTDPRGAADLRAAAAFSIGTLAEPRRLPLLVAARWGEEVTEDRIATMREFRQLP